MDECWRAYVPLGPISSDKIRHPNTRSPLPIRWKQHRLFHTDIRRLPGLRTGGKTLCRTVVTWDLLPPRLKPLAPSCGKIPHGTSGFCFYVSHQLLAVSQSGGGAIGHSLCLGPHLPEAPLPLISGVGVQNVAFISCVELSMYTQDIPHTKLLSHPTINAGHSWRSK